MVKFSSLAQFPLDHLSNSVMPSLIFLCDSLIHSLIMWLTVSSLSPHNLHLLFCCVLSIVTSIYFLLMALFCAAIYIGMMVRVFANGPGDLGSIPGRIIPKTQKMVLDAALLNTQHYKVWIKAKVEESRERSGCPLLHLGVVAIEGEPSVHPRLRSPTLQLLEILSLLRLPLLWLVWVISGAISTVYRLTYPHSCFSSHFVFLLFVLQLTLLLDFLFPF